MPVLDGLKVKVIEKDHWNNGRDQKKNGEFAQDGGVFKGCQEECFFGFLFHGLTLILILHLAKKNFIFLGQETNPYKYITEFVLFVET